MQHSSPAGRSVSSSGHAPAGQSTYSSRSKRSCDPRGGSIPSDEDELRLGGGFNTSDARREPASGPKRDHSDQEDKVKVKRAAQACVGCRKHKLRCLGGHPCKRCIKHGLQCDFERPSQNKPDPVMAVNDRFAALENTMAAILANMGAGGNHQQPRIGGLNAVLPTPINSQQSPQAQDYKPFGQLSMDSNDEIVTSDWRDGVVSNERKAAFLSSQQHIHLRNSLDEYTMAAEGNAAAGPSTYLNGTASIPDSIGSSYPNLPPPPPPVAQRQNSHPNRFALLDSGQGTSSSSMREIQSLFEGGQLPSPSNSLPQSARSNPFSDGTRQLMPAGLSPASIARLNGTFDSKNSGPSPESRLKAATAPSSRFSPPFKAITFNPKVWDNREQSRRASPEPDAADEIASGQIDRLPRSPSTPPRPRYGAKDDPVRLGIITETTAAMLFDHYACHLHPFLPVVDLSDPRDAHKVVREKSPFLFSCIMAVAARFSSYFHDGSLDFGEAANNGVPAIVEDAYVQMVMIAEDHLSRSLLRKQHTLSDVQATLLLAGWGLHSAGGGPDSWLLTGHAFRLSRRLGLHLDDTKLAQDPHFPSGEEGEMREGKFMARRRTWLCLSAFDCLLSLGFGRPPSQPIMEAIDTNLFLSVLASRPLAPPSVGAYDFLSAQAGDYFIASQAQLMQISRDFIRSVEAMRLEAEVTDAVDIGMTTTVMDLNQRLDQWCRSWVWSSAPYAPFLHGSSRNAKLCCDHVRLCVNSVLLRPKTSSSSSDNHLTQDNSMEEGCLDKAIAAATAIIQSHYDASLQDQAMCYAVDYFSITLAHAALFLLRVAQHRPKIDNGVIRHNLQQAIDAAERSDKSSTRLLTALAKLIREVSRAAGFTNLSSMYQQDTDDPLVFPDPMLFLNDQEFNLHNPLELQQDYLAYLFNSDPTVDFGWT